VQEVRPDKKKKIVENEAHLSPTLNDREKTLNARPGSQWRTKKKRKESRGRVVGKQRSTTLCNGYKTSGSRLQGKKRGTRTRGKMLLGV